MNITLSVTPAVGDPREDVVDVPLPGGDAAITSLSEAQILDLIDLALRRVAVAGADASTAVTGAQTPANTIGTTTITVKTHAGDVVLGPVAFHPTAAREAVRKFNARVTNDHLVSSS